MLKLFVKLNGRHETGFLEKLVKRETPHAYSADAPEEGERLQRKSIAS